MQGQILQIADLYKANSKYPVFSTPVVGQRFSEPVEPFEEAEVDSVYPSDSDDLEAPLRITASVEKMQYFEGDQIIARLLISGGQITEHSQINAIGSIVSTLDGREAGLVTSFERYGDSSEYLATFDTRALKPGVMPSEAMMKAAVFIEGENVAAQTVPFFFTSSPLPYWRMLCRHRWPVRFYIFHWNMPSPKSL
jgi:hypothetical protein